MLNQHFLSLYLLSCQCIVYFHGTKYDMTFSSDGISAVEMDIMLYLRCDNSCFRLLCIDTDIIRGWNRWVNCMTSFCFCFTAPATNCQKQSV